MDRPVRTSGCARARALFLRPRHVFDDLAAASARDAAVIVDAPGTGPVRDTCTCGTPKMQASSQFYGTAPRFRLIRGPRLRRVISIGVHAYDSDSCRLPRHIARAALPRSWGGRGPNPNETFDSHPRPVESWCRNARPQSEPTQVFTVPFPCRIGMARHEPAFDSAHTAGGPLDGCPACRCACRRTFTA